MKHWGKTVVAIVAVILLLFVVAVIKVNSMLGPLPPTVAPNITAQQQHIASAAMGLTFPSQTKFLFYWRAKDGWQLPFPDDFMCLKIEMPAAALDTFLSQSAFDKAEWESADDIPMSGKSEWPDWQPDKFKAGRRAYCELPTNDGLNILIDDDRQDIKTIYLIWSQR